MEEEGHTERRYNHFRLIDLTREELYAMGVTAILDDDEEESIFFVSDDDQVQNFFELKRTENKDV